MTTLGSWAWAAVILVGTLSIGFGLTALAAQVSRATVPPGALVFGSATVNPAPGWTVAERTPFGVTLDNQGVQMQFTFAAAEGDSAEVRAQALARQLGAESPQLTVRGEPSPFRTDQGAAGSLIALAGTSLTAVAAAVVDAGEAVDVQASGAPTPFGESIADIDDMLRSIRFVTASDG